VRQCPACGYKGRATGFGRFKCSSCGQHFILGWRGRSVNSLLAAMLPTLLIVGIMVTIHILSVSHEVSELINMPVLIVVMVGIEIFNTIQTKRFPNVDAD
jgi:hypothetical protein